MPEVSFFICFGNYNDFSYFLPDFFRLLGWVWELFWGFLQFQLLFLGFSPAFGLGLGAVLRISAVSATFSRIFSGFWAGFGSCFENFCSFSYFFSDFFRLSGWVWVAVLEISAVSATFSRIFSGFRTEFGLFLLHLVGTRSELPLLAFWPAHLL